MMYKEYQKKQTLHLLIDIMLTPNGQLNKIKSDLLDKRLILLIIHNIKVIRLQVQAHILYQLKYQKYSNKVNLYHIHP